jgi:hypothetical protein
LKVPKENLTGAEPGFVALITLKNVNVNNLFISKILTMQKGPTFPSSDIIVSSSGTAKSR